jgi:hypothetical protein
MITKSAVRGGYVWEERRKANLLRMYVGEVRAVRQHSPMYVCTQLGPARQPNSTSAGGHTRTQSDVRSGAGTNQTLPLHNGRDLEGRKWRL